MNRCYNIGCCKSYTDQENVKDSCRYHLKPPVFHDGRKGWECCNRYSTDFSTCLNTPGCQVGFHNPDKPKEPEKPKLDPKFEASTVVVETPKPVEKKRARPSDEDEMVSLKVVQLGSLQPALAKRKEELMKTNGSKVQANGDVPLGTNCKNSGCKTMYTGPDSLRNICLYHSGVPIFHEGLKFWSCCNRKTTEFEAFMNQEGCTSGSHVWFKEPSLRGDQCRYDWFQDSDKVTLSVYAKLPVPTTFQVLANSVKLHLNFDFDAGEAHYDRIFHLAEPIDLNCSSVKLGAAKVEIILKKADGGAWSSLELSLTSGSS